MKCQVLGPHYAALAVLGSPGLDLVVLGSADGAFPTLGK